MIGNGIIDVIKKMRLSNKGKKAIINNASAAELDKIELADGK
jgi:hypothetical protein